MKPKLSDETARVNRLLDACAELAERLGMRVVREPMSSVGGLCRVRGEWRLYLNPNLDPLEQLILYTQAFARFDLSDHYVLPALRDEIERSGER